ncbi:hypothetical protein CHUAL_000296 [Chamberlinius hualienensis]
MEVGEETKPLCSFCKEISPRYTCPRCNFSYCSVNCYRHPQHASCSEGFYQDWVVSHMKDSKNSQSEAKDRMVEILNRRRDDLDSDDDDDEPDLAERIQGVNLDDSDEVWEKLTAEERSEFRRLLDNEEINSVLPEWKPWWHYKETVSLVTEVDKLSYNSTLLPPIWSRIPRLDEMTQVKPAVCLKYSVINCLYGYVYLVKFYNGDYIQFPLEFITSMIKISKSLENSSKIWNDCESAIASVKQEIQQDTELSNTNTFLNEVVNEVKLVVEGSSPKNRTDHALRVLTDIMNRILSAKKQLENTKPCTAVKDIKRKLSLVERKVLFYLSWVQDFGCTELETLDLQLNVIFEMDKKELNEFEEQKKFVSVAVDKIKAGETASLKVEEIQ